MGTAVNARQMVEPHEGTRIQAMTRWLQILLMLAFLALGIVLVWWFWFRAGPALPAIVP